MIHESVLPPEQETDDSYLFFLMSSVTPRKRKRNDLVNNRRQFAHEHLFSHVSGWRLSVLAKREVLATFLVTASSHLSVLGEARSVCRCGMISTVPPPSLGCVIKLYVAISIWLQGMYWSALEQ